MLVEVCSVVGCEFALLRVKGDVPLPKEVTKGVVVNSEGVKLLISPKIHAAVAEVAQRKVLLCEHK